MNPTKISQMKSMVKNQNYNTNYFINYLLIYIPTLFGIVSRYSENILRNWYGFVSNYHRKMPGGGGGGP